MDMDRRPGTQIIDQFNKRIGVFIGRDQKSMAHSAGKVGTSCQSLACRMILGPSLMETVILHGRIGPYCA